MGEILFLYPSSLVTNESKMNDHTRKKKTKRKILKKLCLGAWELPHLRDSEEASPLDRTSPRKTALISTHADTVPPPVGLSSNYLPQYLLLLLPLPAVAEEVLPRLLTPPALIIISEPELLEIRCCRCMPAF